LLEFTIYALLLSIIALGPILGVFICKVKPSSDLWKIFIFGGIIWLLALISRTPLLLFQSIFPSNLVYFAYAAILAGLFEEFFRYFFMKKWQKFRKSRVHVFSMGLGWGFFEALLIYVLSIISIAILLDLGASIPELPSYASPFEFFVSGLAGAFERWVATLLHVSLTFIVFQALKRKIYLYLAITIHTIVDFMALIIYHTTQNIVLTEFAITIFALIVAFYALKILPVCEQISEESFSPISDID